MDLMRSLDLRKALSRVVAERVDAPAPVDAEGVDGELAAHALCELQALYSHKDIVRVLARIDDRRFASAGDDRTVIVWDAVTGRRLLVLEGHTLPVACLLVLPPLAPNGEPLLASGAADRTIRIWSLTDGSELFCLRGHEGAVKCLLALENGHICSGGNDYRLLVWTREGKLVGEIDRQDQENLDGLLLIRNNRLVAASASSLLVYNVSTFSLHKPLSSLSERIHREAVRCLAHVSDGLFASASLDGAIVLWSKHTLNPVRRLHWQPSYKDEQKHMFLYPVQHMVAVNDRYLLAAIGSGFSVFDVQTGECIVQCSHAHFSTVHDVILLYYDTRIVTCSADASIRIWAPEGVRYNPMLSLSITADANRQGSTTALRTESGDIGGGGRSRSISLSSSTPSLSSTAGGAAPTSSGRGPNSQFAVWTALGAAPVAATPLQQQVGGDVPMSLAATSAAGASPAAALLGATGVGTPRRSAGPMKPVCVGELTAHADAVNALLAVSPFALAAAGSDGLVSLWKDGLVESQRRNEVAQVLLARWMTHGARETWF